MKKTFILMIVFLLIISIASFSLVYRNDTAPSNIYLNNSNNIMINNTILNNITNNVYFNITNNITNTIFINNTNNITVNIMSDNTSLKSYIDALYYSIFNPQNFINDSISILTNFYNKNYIDNLISNYTTISYFLNENTSLWIGINSKLNSNDQRYNDTNMISSVNSSLYSYIINNYFNSSSDFLNDSYYFNLTNNAIRQNISVLSSNLITAFLNNDTANFNTINNSINGKVGLTGENLMTGNYYVLGNFTFMNVFVSNSTLGYVMQIGSTIYLNISYDRFYFKNNMIIDGNINASNFYGSIGYQYVQNPIWLNITDQRYNDTSLIPTNTLNLTNGNNFIANNTNAKLLNLSVNQLYFGNTSWLYTDAVTNNSYIRFLNGNFSILDASDTIMTFTQDDNVLIRQNLSIGNVFQSKEIDLAYDGNFSTHIIYPNSPLTISGNVNSYMQVVIQNKNNGTTASSDLVITADNGNDAENYTDIGINNRNYNEPVYNVTDKLSGYWIHNAIGNLTIGTALQTGIRFFTGGTTIDKVRMYIDSIGRIGINTQNPSQLLTVNNGNISINQGYKVCYDASCSSFTCRNSTGSLIISNNRTGVSCN